jgi:hypothetical protein
MRSRSPVLAVIDEHARALLRRYPSSPHRERVVAALR